MRSHEQLLADIAREHYLEGLSKVEIAKRRGISRFLVARHLDEAREREIVRIEIRSPDSAGIDALALAERLGARGVTIVDGDVPIGADPAAHRGDLARAVAAALIAEVRPGMTIGISWSRTLELLAAHVTELPAVELVQLAGALPLPGSQTSVELIQRLGAVSGGRTRPIWAPLLVEDAATADGLHRQPEIAETLARADALDLAVVAFGSWEPGRSTIYDRVGNELRRRALMAGAIAECSGRLFDSAGQPVDVLDDRIVAVTLQQLIDTPVVIGVGSGASAAPGVIASVSSGLATDLIVDESLGHALAHRVGLIPDPSVPPLEAQP